MENETKFDDPLDDSDEIEIVSKTQLKRESIDIQNLGSLEVKQGQIGLNGFKRDQTGSNASLDCIATQYIL